MAVARHVSCGLQPEGVAVYHLAQSILLRPAAGVAPGATPAEQREALILVGAGGFSYEDAARISNCAVGTVKSRVARARKALSAALEGNGPLSSEPRPAGGDATNEIMAQLARLAPLDAPESGEASNGERDAT